MKIWNYVMSNTDPSPQKPRFHDVAGILAIVLKNKSTREIPIICVLFLN